ncbi:MAG TPA: endonuclease/exonuclease/phosphatase family protein [Bacteroidales bacterium]
MAKYICIILITVWLFPALDAQKLRVATYNIRNENSGDVKNGNGWKQRCPVIVQLIRFHDFDIFGAQEVLYGQLNNILEKLSEYGYIGVGRDDGDKAGEFAPIFYKKAILKPLQTGHFWLSEIEDKPNKGWDAALSRICTWGKFQINETDKIVWFFNLHMDHIGVKARLESSKLVIQKIKTMCSGEPVILTGDFNVDQTSDGYKYIVSSGILSDSYETSLIRYSTNGTFNNFDANLKTDSRIDHIFTGKAFQVSRYGVLTDSYRSEIDSSAKDIKSANFPKEVSLHQYISRLPSDHFPVMVEVLLTPNPEK